MFPVYIVVALSLFFYAADTSVCPPGGGIVCYPNECSDQYQRCADDIFYPPEPIPKGLLCREGLLVFPSTCSLSSCPQPSCSLSQIFSEADFNRLFPHANGGAILGVENQHKIFTYSNLISAATNHPMFACTGSAEERRRELAAFLAQTSQETSGWWTGQPYIWGYYFSTETGCTNSGCTQYCDPYVSDYPCSPGKGYFGRGPIQISWNYNYGKFSQALYGNKNILLNDPDLLFSGNTAFASALWFWMTPQSSKPSCHQVMTGQWEPSEDDIIAGRVAGFGLTTLIINGGLECSMPTQQPAENRVQYFMEYSRQFGMSTGPNLYCDNMQHY